MPTYTFLDKRTGEEYDEVMMIAEMEKHKRKKHIQLLLPTGINTMTMTECGRYKKQDVHTTRPDGYETITQTPGGTSWDTFERPNGHNNPTEPFVRPDGKIQHSYFDTKGYGPQNTDVKGSKEFQKTPEGWVQPQYATDRHRIKYKKGNK